MRCYYHLDHDAVAACSVCGRFLCKDCADKHSPIMCEECYHKALEKERERASLEEEEKEREEERKRQKEIAEERKQIFELKKAWRDEKRAFIRHIIVGLFFLWLFYYTIHPFAGLLAFFMPFGWYKNQQNETDKVVDAVYSSGNYALSYYIGKLLGFVLKCCLCVVLGIPFFIRDIVVLVKDAKYMKEISQPETADSERNDIQQ